jgi:hypothetical protein
MVRVPLFGRKIIHFGMNVMLFSYSVPYLEVELLGATGKLKWEMNSLYLVNAPLAVKTRQRRREIFFSRLKI